MIGKDPAKRRSYRRYQIFDYKNSKHFIRLQDDFDKKGVIEEQVTEPIRSAEHEVSGK